MPKDRYSNDYIIEVVGDNNKVIINDNLTVSNDMTASGSVITNVITDESGGDVEVQANLIVNDNLTVKDDATVDGDTTLTGELDVGGTLTAGNYLGPRSIDLFIPIKVQLFNATAIIDATSGFTSTINMSSYGFTSADTFFQITLLINDAVGNTRWFSTGYNFTGADMRYGFLYEEVLQDLTIYFEGANWPAGPPGANFVEVKISAWYVTP